MPDLLPASHPRPRTAARLRERIEADARAACQTAYLGDHTALCRVLGKFLCYVDTRDRHLAPHLMMNGFWEPWITAAILERVRPGMVCVDVGANLGYFTMLLADLAGPSGAVLAFEPNPRLLELCKSSLSANGFRDRAVATGLAASDRDGQDVQLTFDLASPMNGTITGGNHAGATTVRTVRLDTACANLPRVDFFKIDVEGAEELVWDGMQGLLDKNPNATVVMEWNAKRNGAERLLDKVHARFPTLRHIGFDSEVEEITRERLLTERGAEDFMLFLRR